jgi:YVTN family beta-propeller protein
LSAVGAGECEFVHIRGSQNVSVIDGDSKAVIATLMVGPSPSAVVVDPNTNRIYVANFNGNSVSVIDGSSNTVVSTITVGSHPDALAINTSLRRVYVGNYGDYSISVINQDSSQVETVATMGGVPQVAIAANSTTNRVYTTSGSSILEMQDGNSPQVWITVAPAAPNGQSGWYTHPVYAEVALTQLDDPAWITIRCALDPPPGVTTYPPMSLITGDPSTAITATCQDLAGNTATATSKS